MVVISFKKEGLTLKLTATFVEQKGPRIESDLKKNFS